MYEWQKRIQQMIGEIDISIKNNNDETLSLRELSKKFGYSEFHFSRKFKEISGMQFRDYLRYRRLAFALKELRDTEMGILDIALKYGFSSHEAFSRAFKEAYGITPSEYRQNPRPVVLRTIIKPFDCYLSGIGGIGMEKSTEDIKIYFVTIPKHKFLHIKNYESIGYWDFWQKQSLIPGQDCETICGLLDSIKGKLADIPEGEYIVFEHGPFDYEKENCGVEEKIEEAMKNFDYTAAGYCLDTTPGRVFYFYHDPERFWKFVRPVRRV